MRHEILIVQPVEDAFNKMRNILFCSFSLEKWLILGFAAFLAELGSSGVNVPFGPSVDGNTSAEDLTANAVNWINENMMFIAVAAAVAILLILAIITLFQWLSSRGKFMLLDCIVNDRFAVKEPWHRLREEGNQLFVFQFFFSILSFLFMTSLLFICAVLAWPDIEAFKLGEGGSLALLLGGCVGVPAAFVFGSVQHAVEDFVIPIMYVKKCSTMTGLGIFWRDMVVGHAWSITLFYLMKILLGIAAGIMKLMLVLCTCCLLGLLIAIPFVGWYLGAVVFLPVPVFMRSYSLYYIEQHGDEWCFFRREQQPEE